MSKLESQFPTATFALKSFFGLLLGSCASAVWTFHRAHLCQRAVRSYFEDMECGLHGDFLQSTSHRRRDAIRFACISDSTTPMEKKTSKVNQLISRGLFEFRTNVATSCNFSSDIAHLSYQNQGGSKTRSRQRALAVTPPITAEKRNHQHL
jgi:hypothetical protein